MELDDEAVLAAVGPSSSTAVSDVAPHAGDAAQQQRDADAAAASLTDHPEETEPSLQRVSLEISLSFREVRSGPCAVASPARYRPRRAVRVHAPETQPQPHLGPLRGPALSASVMRHRTATCGHELPSLYSPARDLSLEPSPPCTRTVAPDLQPRRACSCRHAVAVNVLNPPRSSFTSVLQSLEQLVTNYPDSALTGSLQALRARIEVSGQTAVIAPVTMSLSIATGVEVDMVWGWQ